MRNKRSALDRQAYFFSIVSARALAFLHWEQFIPVIRIRIAADYAKIAGFQFPNYLRTYTHLELAAIDPGQDSVTLSLARHEFPPFFWNPG
jgi:hypothetical protein